MDIVKVRFFGGRNSITTDWLDPSYEWIKSLYLVNILMMKEFRSTLHVFYFLSWLQFFICATYISFPFSYCMTYFYWYATCQTTNALVNICFLQLVGVIVFWYMFDFLKWYFKYWTSYNILFIEKFVVSLCFLLFHWSVISVPSTKEGAHPYHSANPTLPLSW